MEGKRIKRMFTKTTKRGMKKDTSKNMNSLNKRKKS